MKKNTETTQLSKTFSKKCRILLDISPLQGNQVIIDVFRYSAVEKYLVA